MVKIISYGIQDDKKAFEFQTWHAVLLGGYISSFFSLLGSQVDMYLKEYSQNIVIFVMKITRHVK